MAHFIAFGAGAGLVAALLFGVVATGSPGAMLLSYVAPLPIVIVALGWHHLLGILAASLGALALSFGLRPSAGVAFALGPAFPAWFLAYLALLGRAVPAHPGHSPSFEWPTAGRLAFWTGLAGASIALAAAVGLGSGDHAQFEETLRRATQTLLRSDLGPTPRTGATPAPDGTAVPTIVNVLVVVAPAVAAAIFSLALALNLWAGGRVVLLSGRLPRPWPAAPEMRMPLEALVGFAAGLFLAFGSGWVGITGRAVAGGLGMMFALQGLALLHATTQGRQGRGAVLTLAYILALFFGGTFLPVLAMAGMVDTATPLRPRFNRSKSPHGRNGPPPLT